MKLTLSPYKKTELTTISKLLINDAWHGMYVLEDVDRGLDSTMTVDEIRQIKVHGATAIPAGVYDLVINFSARFQKYMPLLIGVKGFTGVRIHPGNTHLHTEGCLLVGYGVGTNMLLDSKRAWRNLIVLLKSVERVEKMIVEVKR